MGVDGHLDNPGCVSVLKHERVEKQLGLMTAIVLGKKVSGITLLRHFTRGNAVLEFLDMLTKKD